MTFNFFILIFTHFALENLILKEKKKLKKKIEISEFSKNLMLKEKDENYIKNKLAYKTRIPVGYGTDDKNVFPTLVAIISLVENAGPNTYYDIFILHPGNFNMGKNLKIFKSVEKNHYNNCSINLINMGNKYSELPFKKNRTMAPTYYRLDIHNKLPGRDRAIWLDGDTLVFEDLSDLIKIDMKGNYVLGFPDSFVEHMETFGLKNSTMICAGVLLIDLEGLRKNNYTEKINNFIIKERNRLKAHDQTVLNAVLHGKKGLLPPKYGMWSFPSKNVAKKHFEKLKPWAKYDDEKEFMYAMNHPAILHFIFPKPFWNTERPPFRKEWWDYARKSEYFKEIFKYAKNYRRKK